MESQQKIEFPQKSKRQRLEKLKAFICFHEVQPKQIWGDQSYLRIPMFANKFFDKYGYKISVDQLMGLRILADEGENLHIQSFHEIVYETKQIKNIASKVSKVRNRPQTANQFNKKKYQKEQKVLTYNTKLNLTQKTPEYAETMTVSRIKQADQNLQKKIIENALDKKWEYLIKVGEMNAWNKQTNLLDGDKIQGALTKKTCKSANKIYKVHGQDQSITIVEQKQNGEAEVLPFKVFDQKYQSMKKKVTKEQKLKNNMKGTMLLVLEKKDKVSKAKLCERISQRDHQLNYLLLQIMRMKNIFEQQQQVLSQCGVNM